MLEILTTALIAGALIAPAVTFGIIEEKREMRKEKNDLFFKKIENFKF